MEVQGDVTFNYVRILSGFPGWMVFLAFAAGCAAICRPAGALGASRWDASAWQSAHGSIQWRGIQVLARLDGVCCFALT